MRDNRGPWAKVRPRLKAMDKPAIDDLLGALWAFSEENRAIIEFRLALHGRPEEALATYRKLIDREFDMSRNNAPLRIGRARMAIHGYWKATGDGRGTLELLVHLVEKGTRFTLNYGDIDERFYTNLEATFEEAVSRLRERDGSAWLADFRPRPAKVVYSASDTGWGYGDTLNELFEIISKPMPGAQTALKGRVSSGGQQDKLDV